MAKKNKSRSHAAQWCHVGQFCAINHNNEVVSMGTMGVMAPPPVGTAVYRTDLGAGKDIRPATRAEISALVLYHGGNDDNV